MSSSGPVPLGLSTYVPRNFEIEALNLLRRSDWVLLLGPRQHGKTSALIRINAQLKADGFRSAIVDLQAMPAGLSFPDMLGWFAASVAKGLKVDSASSAAGSNSLEDWLAPICVPGPPIVVLIDEAASIRDEESRNAFFGQIRAFKSQAASDPDCVAALLTFAFAGTFRPETLVDEKNSPFNVCHRLESEDLDEVGVSTLASAVLGEDVPPQIAQMIFDRIGGQPELAQRLLALASSAGPENAIDRIEGQLSEWEIHSNDHLDAVFRVVLREPGLKAIATALVMAGDLQIDPANSDFRYAVVAGLCKKSGGRLRFRSALVEAVARASPQLHPEEAAVRNAHFFPMGPGGFAFMRDAVYSEIASSSYDGAIKCMRSGAYRLALAGLGVCIEAVLIDFMLRQPIGSVAAAIAASPAAARPNFDRHETQADPESWRLVNLLKVGRLVRAGQNVELPETLREFRNLVHPKLIKASYKTEEQTYPEAVTAIGLAGIVFRDFV